MLILSTNWKKKLKIDVQFNLASENMNVASFNDVDAEVLALQLELLMPRL